MLFVCVLYVYLMQREKKEKRAGVKTGSLADLRQRKLDSQARVAGAVADISGTMENVESIYKYLLLDIFLPVRGYNILDLY